MEIIRGDDQGLEIEAAKARHPAFWGRLEADVTAMGEKQDDRFPFLQGIVRMGDTAPKPPASEVLPPEE